MIPFTTAATYPFGEDPPQPVVACATSVDPVFTAQSAQTPPQGEAPDAATDPWPKDIPHPAPDNTPWILRELKVRLERYLNAPAQWLPVLNLINGSPRQQRSERRIACVQLLRSMLKYCDLATLRIGIPGKDGWINLTLSYLAEQAGLELRRAERALHDLKMAGLAKLWPQFERLDTEQGESYKGLAAIKFLPVKLFAAFGLGDELNRERPKAHLRAQRRRAQQYKQDRQGAQMAAQLMGAVKGMGRRTKSAHDGDSARKNADYERNLMLLAGQIKAQHLDWDRDACYAEARRQLHRPPE